MCDDLEVTEGVIRVILQVFALIMMIIQKNRKTRNKPTGIGCIFRIKALKKRIFYGKG